MNARRAILALAVSVTGCARAPHATHTFTISRTVPAPAQIAAEHASPGPQHTAVSVTATVPPGSELTTPTVSISDHAVSVGRASVVPGTRTVLPWGLIILGAALVAGGVILFVKYWRWEALVAGAGTGGLIMLAVLRPDVLVWGLVIAGVLVVLAVSALVVSRHRYREALRAVVAGIEGMPDPTGAKSSIALHADDRDRDTIRRVKRADGF